ncbi:mannosyl-3-phosphoglycerate synthase, partial [Apiosordaria backusii]
KMRYSLPLGSRPFGPLCIMHQMEVVELEPRPTNNDNRLSDASEFTVAVFEDELNRILEKLVIVVPCKDEDVEVIRGVVKGIPSLCAVILVSNCSHRHGDNGWEAQARMLAEFCTWGREGCFVHQKYPRAATAFREAGVPEVIDPATGTLRNGKGEGMYLGIAMAQSYFSQRRYIGFIDADNRVPGSVTEYCKAYAGGFALVQRSFAKNGTEPEDVMVRICWASKPKHNSETGRIEFVKEGRSSRIVNAFLNKLFAVQGKEKDFITTGNAGEHAMTMDMALRMRMANGYAIEPYQYIEPLLRHQSSMVSSGINGQTDKPYPLKRTRILQIKTTNPHLHRATGNDHITKMWAAGLGVLYHHLLPSRACEISGLDTNITELCREMRQFAVKNSAIRDTEELPRPTIYPSLDHADLNSFRDFLGEPCPGHDGSEALGFYGLVGQA